MKNDYEMEKEKFEKMMIEKEVPMKSMAGSVVDLETTTKLLQTGKSLLMKTDKEFISCSSQTTMAGDLIMDKLIKIFPL